MNNGRIIYGRKSAHGKTHKAKRIKQTRQCNRILEPVVSDEMADLGMFLELRKPKSADEVAALAGKPVERVSKLLAENRRFVPVGMGLMRVIPMLSPLLRKQESACL